MAANQAYIVVQSSKAETLALYVSERMGAGYRPLGAPFYVPPSENGHGGAIARGPKVGTFAQAMVYAPASG